MVKKCRCHGTSGSCTMKTCWMQLAPFSEMAKILRGRYEKAVHVKMNNKRNAIAAETIEELVDKSNAERLVYLVSSPNYCKMNKKRG